ncbi:hypothetical protein [Streptantibioticus ferralitis]|uniref:Conjugal transfer protein n=1 Tax=Streptantibioticus ferralitis TaxID=236510 RepID=A0ABT5Z3W9_9ACTN|nr:hypothetical protein [Streptantibioticus ferralitis]MDF2258522.1 hypothetical protein [Streptantibioticus ferralitis]
MSDDKESRRKPPPPQHWRDLLKADYAYPDDLVSPQDSKRQRRRARKQWRADDRDARKEWIQRKREAEPVTPGGVIVVMAVILLIGAGTAWLSHSGGKSGGATAAASPTAVAPSIAPPSDSTGASAPTASASPVVDTQNPDAVASAFITAYLTRNPVKDQTWQPSVQRATPWMTSALHDNLMQFADPAFKRLVIQGGVARVVNVAVQKGGDGLPVDLPKERVYRATTASIEVTADKTTTQTRTLHLELVYGNTGWLVSRIPDLA